MLGARFKQNPLKALVFFVSLSEARFFALSFRCDDFGIIICVLWMQEQSVSVLNFVKPFPRRIETDSSVPRALG